MARRLGSSDDEIAAVLAGDFTGFEPAWAAALSVADGMTVAAGVVDPGTWSRLAAHWQPEQMVEIVSVAAAFALFNRFANALEIPPTR